MGFLKKLLDQNNQNNLILTRPEGFVKGKKKPDAETILKRVQHRVQHDTLEDSPLPSGRGLCMGCHVRTPRG
jgi:hypothetical protein